MKRNRILLGLSALLCGGLLGLQAQPSLVELVDEANANWMMGTWVGTMDNGATFTHTFKWDLNKQIIVMRGEIDDMSFMGVTSVDAETGEPKYVGWDSRGSHSKGTWADEGGEPALRIESKTSDGETRKMAVVFGRGTGGTLKIALHGLDEWGYLQTPAFATLELKKKK